MFDVSFFCCVRHILTLLNFTLCANRPKVLDAVNAVDACSGTSDRSCIFQVTLDHFDALLPQGSSRVASRISSQSSQLPSLWQHVADDRAALPPRCSGDEHSTIRITHTSIPPIVSEPKLGSGTYFLERLS